MIDLTVKTLDSRNHAFSMPDDATVRQLKEKIQDAMSILADRQRLIFHGRVMADDKKLSEYEVHGMVIHLVKSQPPQPGSRHGGSSSSNNTSSSDNTSRPSGPRYIGRVDGGTMLGSVVIPVIGETGGRHGAWRLMSTADRMIQRAVEVLDNHENSASRSASVVPSVTTTPYNSSRDSSGSHSPTTETSQQGRAASETRATAASSNASAQPSTSAGTEGMDTEMDTDSNTATPQITVSSADQTGSTAASGGSAPSGASQEGSGQESNPQRQQRGTPSTSNMASLLAKLQALQARFNPLLARYHTLISEDAPTNNAQQLTERLSLTQTVPEVLHLLSHAYHAISELTIDWELAPPRQMRPLIAPAIQQLVQLTEGMNPWDLTIPTTAFGQPGQPQPTGAAGTTASGTSAASTGGTSTSTPANSTTASASAANGGSIPEVTYMTTTFPAEGGEATTTFTTRPAANFETAPGAASANAPTGTNASNRTPVVTASIDLSGRNTGFTAALNAAFGIINRITTHQAGHQHNHQQQQAQQPQQEQQAQQQQQPQQGQARGGPIVTLPVGMIDIPANVEFFMGVGPSTITIDSVEATMVTSSGFTPGTNGAATDALNFNFPWGSPPPEAFLQGVVHALNRMITTPNANPNMRRRGSAPENTQNPNLQRRGSAPESVNTEANPDNTPAAGSTPSASSSPGAPGQTSQARGYTATNPTTSTQTRSTARPHVHHIAATQFPGYSLSYTDPFLPCHSQFFASWRRSRPNANSGSSTTTNNATQTSGNATPGTLSTTSAASQTSGNTSSSASASASGSASVSSATTATSQNSSQSQRADLHNSFVETLLSSDLNSDSDSITRTLGALVATIGQGNQADVRIIDWMFPGSQPHEGESLLSDLRLAVVQNVTMSDLVALLENNWDALNHIRSDLRQFVVQRLCEGSPSEENVEHGVNLLMTELRPHFNIILEGTPREDIDAVASLNRFHESFIPEFLKLILDDEHASRFGQNLHDLIYKYLGQLWAIVKHCCGNDEAIYTVFQSCLDRLTNGSLAGEFFPQFRMSSDSFNVPLQDIEPFIVHRTSVPEMSSPATSSSESCSSADTMKMEQPADETSPQMQNSASQDTIEPMDTVEPQSPPQATTSAASVICDTPSHSNCSEATESTKSAEIAEATGLSAMDTDVPPVPTPEAWHRIVPPEWVPIIARDVTRQRRPNSQPPLSDAYLAGMPPKRRKVVTADKPQGSLGEVISANMESAIQSSGVSTAGISMVQEEAGSDPRLQEAYREQFRATVRANLANNPDFSAERFPNAAQYFGKS